ncbi:MAG: AtpZ/AtpI family protein [Cyclobacteriaceae bacterium]
METPKKNPSSKPNPDQASGYAKISGITFELLGINLIPIALGYYLHSHFGGSFPWILILAVFMAVAGTIFYLIKKFVD